MNSRKRRIAIKRGVDTALIIVFSPVITLALAGAAVAVRVSMGSPVLFRQRRIGLHEQSFSVLKFRTMSNERDSEGKLLPDHRRLTKTGRMLRKLSLDELPQLINVIRGDMALVGPRPLLVEYLEFYRERERLRHTVRPGITGAAQVTGRNGLLWDTRLAIDADYAQRGTLADDVRILGATVTGVFRADGVSIVAGDSGERLDVTRSYPVEGGRSLRRLEVNDAQTRVDWFLDARTAEFMNVPQNITVDGTRQWILDSRKDPARRDFVLYEIESGTVLAMAGVRGNPDPNFPEVHVLVAPDRHGEGLGSQTMRLLVSWMREQEALTGCWLTVHPQNLAGRRLYERLGFSQVPLDSEDRLKMELNWSDQHA